MFSFFFPFALVVNDLGLNLRFIPENCFLLFYFLVGLTFWVWFLSLRIGFFMVVL